MALNDELRAAYSQTGASWQRGPARVYDRMADLLVSLSPVPVEGSVVADIGAGTGAGGRAARRLGASGVVAVDVAVGMLWADPGRPVAAVADGRWLPFRDRSVDIALAAFSLNHLTDPTHAVEEAARIVRPGGALVAGTYAHDDGHPVKEAVEEALRRHGWQPPGWLAALRPGGVPVLATVEGARSVVDDVGLRGATVARHRVPLPELDAAALVAWRMGMAQHAPFLVALSPEQQGAIAAEARALLGDSPPALVRSVVVVTAVVAQRPRRVSAIADREAPSSSRAAASNATS